MRNFVPLMLLIAILSWMPRLSWGQAGQGIPFSWAKTINGAANDTVTDIVAGKGAYIYACGHFTSASVQLGSQTLTSNGVKDIFVAKYDTAGNLLWVKNMGGTGEDKAVAIAADSLDNIYITGSCGGNASFGALIFTGTNFIAKMNNNGDVLWVTEPATNVTINDIAADPTGNTVICGIFTSNSTIGGTAVMATESADGFVARYNTAGSISWFKQLYGLKPTLYPENCSVSEICTSVAIAPNGRISLGGYTGAVKLVVKSTVGIDTVFNTSITLYEFRRLYGTVGFVMQWDATGNLLWLKDNLMSSTFGFYQIYAHSIATDANANVYVAYERLRRELIYTPHEVRLAKYDNTGSMEWAKFIGYYDGTYPYHGINNPRVAFGEGKVYLAERNTTMSYNETFTTKVHCFSQYGTLRWVSVNTSSFSPIFALAAKETAYTGGIIGHDIYNPNTGSVGNIPVTTVGGSEGVVAKVQNYIPPIVPLAFSAPNRDTTICPGGSIGLTGSNIVTGGVEPYTYSWTPAVSLNNATLLNATASPTATTQYILTATDAQGWQLKDTVVVTVQAPLPKPTIQVIEGIYPSTYDTMVCVSPVAGLTYKWEFSTNYQGEGWSNWGISNARIVVNQRGSKRARVTISNGLNGCAATSEVFYYYITKANAGRDTTICSGQSVTLGGTPPYFGYTGNSGASALYYWSKLPYSWPNTIIVEASPSPYITVNPTVSTDYLLFTSDINGVPRVADTVTVTVIGGTATPAITASGPTTFCQGDTLILTSSPAQTYLWNNGATTQSIKVTASGTYSLMVGNGGTCNSLGSAPVTVTVHPRPDTPPIGTNGASGYCVGDSAKLYTAPAHAYLWSNGATTQQITVFSSGNYSVQTINAQGCKSVPSNSMLVTFSPRPPVPTITASGPTDVCQGGSLTLTASASPGYLWGNSATTQSITVTNGGIFSLRAVNGGCQSATSAPVFVNFFPIPSVPTVTVSGPTSFCQGGSVTLTASPAYGYQWSNGATTQSISVNSGGTYSVIAVGSGGCQSQPSATTTVTILPAPTAPTVAISGPTSFCQGGSVTITASAASGYLWSNGATTQSINVNSSGIYSVRAINTNGCQSAVSAATQVTVYPIPATPVIATSGATSFCQGGSVALTATSANSYLWSNGATTQSIAVNNSGNYSVRVTNANGCQSAVSAATTVTVFPAPATPAITASGPISFCQGGNVKLTSTAGSSYTWSNGATTQSITVNSGGSYTVRVTNASGCQSAVSAPTVVMVNALPSTPTITQSGNTLSSSSPSGNQWYFNGVAIAGATAPSYTYTVGGIFSVTVTNANGCSSSSAPYTGLRMAANTLRNGDAFYHQVSPNPATQNATARYQLKNAATVSVYVVNDRGERVLTVVNQQQQAAGIYTYPINRNGVSLQRGSYYVVYVVDGERFTQNITML